VRVLQLGKFYDPVVGGMETALKEICENMEKQVELRVIVANTRYHTEHDHRNVPVTRVASLGKLFSCSLAPTFPLWSRRFEADLIHVHMPNPLAELSALLVASKTPIVAHFHSDIVRQRHLLRLYEPLLRAFYRRANRIVVPTPRHIEVSQFLREYRDKCRIVPYGVSVARFNLTEAVHNKLDKLRDGPPAILFVGRLVSYKGVEFLIRAMREVAAQLWIVGTGPLESSLRDLSQKEGLSEKVTFFGQVSTTDVVAFYHACTIFALPSITNAEMFGLVQLEAMACRKPVISTSLPTGVSWINEHGKTGYVVPPSDSVQLAKSINYLLNNPELRFEMGEAGRRKVESDFTSAKMAASMFQVYREVVQEPQWGSAPAKRPRPADVLPNLSKSA
jgi:glycosyltransferase involved in cell wall biosynthesis